MPAGHGRNKKRSRVVAISLGSVIAVAGGVIAVPAAMAALVPAPASTPFQLKGAETFDTDKLMAAICPGPTSDRPFQDVGNFFINLDTGEVSPDETNGVGDPGKTPAGTPPLARVAAHCEYPATSVKDSVGAATDASDLIINCGDSVQAGQEITHSLTTSSSVTHSVTVGVGFNLSIVKDVFSIGGGAELTTEWSFGEEVTKSKLDKIDVPPRTVGFLERLPALRTVTSTPVAVLENVTLITPDGVTDQNGWRDNGSTRITSSGFTMTATADVLDKNGVPAGAIRADDRPVTDEDCA
ncbi:hypothetical protein F9278_20520 [Streptomyces phaeolivaceus]|uniref:Uncharacterized protein n=1 Tax=Streptomyces phaeolivaceus TaxID=2653200 RepID=A0A5P8K583_9ACTN|nr:hypothetical protein [Streptomyces phaeolivaceus]QFQ98194.1 hypothetical protein F9278_20520 [Streptomyces phaeolivaceus]